MKAFWVGLLFIAAVFVFVGMWFLLFPIILVLGILLRLAVGAAFVILSVWLLGKFILFVWGKLKK